MTPLALPTFIPRYLPFQAPDEWYGHLAFGHDLVAALRPSLYVAIGPTSGDAYFGVCQTVFEKGLGCTCYGLFSSSDNLVTAHTADLSSYNANHYAGFSYILNYNEDSIRSFSDNSIDLLQITHNPGVKQIFEAWLPKVKSGGFVLLDHVRDRGAGAEAACGLWEHIERTFAETFGFNHAGGLGVFRKAGGAELSSPFLQSLFNSSAELGEHIRRHYIIYSGYLDSVLRRDNATGTLNHKIEELTTELRAAQHERMILEADLAQTQLELTRTQFDRSNDRRAIANLQDSLAVAQSAHEATRLQMQQLGEALQAEQQAKQNLIDSFSWRLTAPARDFMEWMRRHKTD